MRQAKDGTVRNAALGISEEGFPIDGIHAGSGMKGTTMWNYMSPGSRDKRS
jgi:hypothetical protein